MKMCEKIFFVKKNGKMKMNNTKKDKRSLKMENRLDVKVATSRKDEPKRDWEDVKKTLKTKGKL